MSASRAASAVVSPAAGHVGSHGMRGSARSSAASTRATSSCAGCISAQWKGALTGSITARRAPLALAQGRSSFHGRQCAGNHGLPRRVQVGSGHNQPGLGAASAQASATWAASSASTAAIAPCPAGTASCMARPRAFTARTASAKLSVPAATWADHSPSECPGGQRRLHAVCGQHAQRCHAHRQNGRLGVLSEFQLLVGPLKAEPREREAEASSASAKVSAAGKALGKIRGPCQRPANPAPEKERRSWWTFQRGLYPCRPSHRPDSSSSASCRRDLRRSGGLGRRSGRCGPGSACRPRTCAMRAGASSGSSGCAARTNAR
jgi:hypothetical protein